MPRVVHPDERERVAEIIRLRAAGIHRSAYESRNLRLDGSCFDSRVFGRSIDYLGRQANLVTTSDISDLAPGPPRGRLAFEHARQHRAAVPQRLDRDRPGPAARAPVHRRAAAGRPLLRRRHAVAAYRAAPPAGRRPHTGTGRLAPGPARPALRVRPPAAPARWRRAAADPPRSGRAWRAPRPARTQRRDPAGRHRARRGRATHRAARQLPPGDRPRDAVPAAAAHGRCAGAVAARGAPARHAVPARGRAGPRARRAGPGRRRCAGHHRGRPPAAGVPAGRHAGPPRRRPSSRSCSTPAPVPTRRTR